jgi:hypothetical protein
MPHSDADDASMAMSSEAQVGDTIVHCPLGSKLKHIKVEVVGEDEQGVSHVPLILKNKAGNVLHGVSARDGVFVFKGLEPGVYQIGLAELDQDAWQVLEHEIYEGSYAEAKAVWTPDTTPPVAGSLVHLVQQGECASKIAYAFGFNPMTVWMHDNNAALRKTRQYLHILAPEDQLYIPAKVCKYRDVEAEMRLKILRKGVPEKLRVRFLSHDHIPREGVKYIVTIKTLSLDVLPPIEGLTDAMGFLSAWISPNAISAKVHLLGRKSEVYFLDLGYLNPIASVSGWQARLNNFGYSCGDEDGSPGPKTRAAIQRFQTLMNLDASGIMDAVTKSKLLSVALA